MEPTIADIQELRNKFVQKVADENKDFHPKDIAKVNNDDKWLRRFLLHHDLDMKEAFNMLIETCEWRKSFKVNDINESNINMTYLNDGSVFVHNRDKDEKCLFIFRLRKHVKGQKDMLELKRIVIYWMERIERQDKGEPVTVFFDMQDSGLSNLDMEFIKFIVSLFKLYYPQYLNFILIFEMPWVLNAAFKIIKSWLPEKAVQAIKFVDKKSLKDYVEPSQALKNWGGQDSYEFVFVPENISETGKIEENKKKVHFANGSQFGEPTVNGFGDSKHDDSPTGYSRLSLNPADAICFTPEGMDLAGTLTITNTSEMPLIYKVKTTSPEKFGVRPCCGVLLPSANASINIVLLAGYTGVNILRDKFLVMSYHIEDDQAHSNVDPNKLWRMQTDPQKLEEHRLRCKVPSTQSLCSHNGSPGNALPTVSSASEFEQKLTQLLISMNHLTDCNVKMQSDITTLRRLVLCILFLVIFFGMTLLLFIRSPEEEFCQASNLSVKLDM